MEPANFPASPYKTILFCTDFSANADFAFAYALDAAVRRPGCALHLLHVIPETDAQFWKTYIYEVEDIDRKAKADIDAKIEQTYRPGVPAGVYFHCTIRVGKDYKEILSFAEEIQADVIILGRQGHGTLGKAFFGRVTEKIARHAACPVLIIPLDYQKKRGL